MKFYLQILDLKVEVFINSIKARIFRRPPLKDENSDFPPYRTFANPLDLTSSGKI
jgi:hypothetical protein